MTTVVYSKTTIVSANQCHNPLMKHAIIGTWAYWEDKRGSLVVLSFRMRFYLNSVVKAWARTSLGILPWASQSQLWAAFERQMSKCNGKPFWCSVDEMEQYITVWNGCLPDYQQWNETLLLLLELRIVGVFWPVAEMLPFPYYWVR